MLPANKSDSLDDESDNYGSDSGSAGTCNFPFLFEDSVGHVENSVGRVCGVVYGIFVLIGIESIGVVVPLVVFIPIYAKSKLG